LQQALGLQLGAYQHTFDVVLPDAGRIHMCFPGDCAHSSNMLYLFDFAPLTKDVSARSQPRRDITPHPEVIANAEGSIRSHSKRFSNVGARSWGFGGGCVLMGFVKGVASGVESSGLQADGAQKSGEGLFSFSLAPGFVFHSVICSIPYIKPRETRS
jgi:hypothetical protein